MKSSQQDECVLCCREIDIYAVGSCDHHVCYECSTRMRVLCETTECPICRSNMPYVVFTHKFQAFSSAEKQVSSCNKTYHILFEDEKISSAFDRLLEHSCKSCEKVCPNFNKLKEHVRREHELHYCDLCSENLKIFTFERKCYSRKDLARHKRNGDPDEKSHRGHPLCEFCDQRYVDRDELFRHLRREHYFCHFCDADGKHQYYRDYEYLRVHFRKDHFLCEEGNCATEKFTAAFRSEIDLKAHVAVHHYKNKSKQEVKQTRLLEFEFAPPPRYPGSSSPRGGRYGQQRRRNEEENASRDRYKANQQAEAESLNTQSVQDFPYLSDEVASKVARGGDISDQPLSLSSFSRNAPIPYRKNVMSAEDFPALCSTSEATTSDASNGLGRKMNYSVPSQPSQKNIKQSINDRLAKKAEQDNRDRTSQQKGKWINKKGNINFEEEFPSLEVRKSQPSAVPSVPVAAKHTQSSNAVSAANRPAKSSNAVSATNKPAQSSSAAPVAIKPAQSFDAVLTRLAETVAKPPVADQFVVIKSKSKKKRPNKINNQLDTVEDIPSASSASTTIEDDQENTDPFKKNLVHPLLSSKPPSATINDYWLDEEVSFQNDDFPPLAPTEPVKKPPGFNLVEKSRAPPPGFTAQALAPKSSATHKSLSTLVREIVMPRQNGNEKSARENDSKEPCYMKPPDFSARNDKLTKRINEITNNPILFNRFKEESIKFRVASSSATEYHAKCLEILGVGGFLEIFPELVSLLPDVEKQQELLAVHNTFLSHKNNGLISKKLSKSVSPVVSCNSCNQVLVIPDCKSHALYHDLEAT